MIISRIAINLPSGELMDLVQLVLGLLPLGHVVQSRPYWQKILNSQKFSYHVFPYRCLAASSLVQFPFPSTQSPSIGVPPHWHSHLFHKPVLLPAFCLYLQPFPPFDTSTRRSLCGTATSLTCPAVLRYFIKP